MQEYIKVTQLAQAMRYTPGKLATVRGSRGKSIVEMINFMEENIKSTDCPKINCDKKLFQTRTCKCGELVHRQEYETLQSCENCGGYQSTIAWYCKTHKRLETSSVVTMIQAMAEDMDADESEKSNSNTCTHPKKERSYIGNNLLRCELCGAEFS